MHIIIIKQRESVFQQSVIKNALCIFTIFLLCSYNKNMFQLNQTE